MTLTVPFISKKLFSIVFDYYFLQNSVEISVEKNCRMLPWVKRHPLVEVPYCIERHPYPLLRRVWCRTKYTSISNKFSIS